jgi:uncharacterized damage-inducible protein DinB
MPSSNLRSRRFFLANGAMLAAAATLGPLPMKASPRHQADPESPWVIGPRSGYTPLVGTLVSMLHFTRMQVLDSVKGLTTEQLDHLHDPKANTIGALLLHLAAVDKIYQLGSFQNVEWENWKDPDKALWDAGLNLGDAGRSQIKGKPLDFYVKLLNDTRTQTLAELKKKDDKWLTTEEKGETPTNPFGQWFHVAEHESNHNGQIKFLKGRIPGLKVENG